MRSNISIADPAESRIIRMTNVHYGVRRHHLNDVFDGYAIEDTFHTKNTAPKKHDVVYILFATAADRNRALGLEGRFLFTREVRIQPVVKGQNYQLNNDETAFVKSTPSKQKQTTTPHIDQESAGQALDIANTEPFPPLPLELSQDQKAQPQAAGKDEQGVFSGTDTVAELTQEGPMELTGPPSKGLWNLNLQEQDTNDPSNNIITPGDWYGFEANQYQKIEREQAELGTNVGKILAKKPGAEDMDEAEAK